MQLDNLYQSSRSGMEIPLCPQRSGLLVLMSVSQHPDGPACCWTFTCILIFLSPILKKNSFPEPASKSSTFRLCLVFLFLTHSVAWRRRVTDSQRKISLLPRPIIYRKAFLTSCVFHLIYFLFFKSPPSKRKCSIP